MWFLEHESLFGGKRVWLRPGSQQLFGRTKSGEDGAEAKSWKIDNKAVSRKHVMLKVHDAPPQNGTQLHTRSQIEVTDLSCRQGTTIDEKTTLKSKKGEDGTLEYDKATLTGTEHTIRLAQGYPPFKIVWQPVVVTYASRESKDSKARSAKLHALDIKTSADFLFDKTTHVVSQKRNLPKVLSGLVAGKHVVSADFLDAVLSVATTSVDEEENYQPSKLEEDFDAWWPKEKDYIPPIGAEPVARPQEMLEPDTSRAEIFMGLTFVFLNESQYNSLLEPVTCGGGKGLLFDVRPGETTIDEYVDYVHSVAGKKKRSQGGKDKLPVVTVRLAGYPDGMEEWAAKFVTGVDQALHQRSILQNEFLDVIITKDRASLQRPPSEIVNIPSSAPESAPTTRSTHIPSPTAQDRALSPAKSASPERVEPVKTITRKRVHRPKTGGRFTGFDDYEPPPKRTKTGDVHMEDVHEEPSQPSALSNGASQHRAAPAIQTRRAQRSPEYEIVAKQEQLDTLFPAAAEIRRQRGETRAPSASVEPEEDVPAAKPIGRGKAMIEKIQKERAKVEGKEIDYREQARIRVKKEDERRRADEENLREALEGIDIDEIRKATKIEEMELRPRADRATAQRSQGDEDRWNAEWNGRKNFKKFRRRGAERGVTTHKVIVPLEEAAPKKGFGVGDPFFFEDTEPFGTFKSFKSRSSRRDQEADSDSEPEPGFVRRKRSQAPEVINVEESEPEEEDEAPVARTQRSSGRTQRVVETQVEDAEAQKQTQTQTQMQTQTQTRGKKRAPTAAPDPPASKRGRVSRRDDDSDEEETGFRFKRRK
ncbi:hypothetical protein IQ06DRAFT_289996 [Phaeosphaeriaceae sp. SRC1lsM3a]|nr:hypothetical protein IQ06DRAFT_289996 [Stagonospora sp. SRC1lsM3a]